MRLIMRFARASTRKRGHRYPLLGKLRRRRRGRGRLGGVIFFFFSAVPHAERLPSRYKLRKKVPSRPFIYTTTARADLYEHSEMRDRARTLQKRTLQEIEGRTNRRPPRNARLSSAPADNSGRTKAAECRARKPARARCGFQRRSKRPRPQAGRASQISSWGKTS